VAIIVGGLWAYETFVRERESIWNLNLSLNAETLPLERSNRLVILRVDLENQGKVAIRPGRDGLQLRVVQIPKDIPPTRLIARQGLNLKGEKQIIYGYNMLAHYKTDAEHPEKIYYEIEPGAKYQETEAMVASEGDILLVSLQFFGSDGDSITQYKYLVVSAGSVFEASTGQEH
jgi:hypothetical protein